MVEPCIHFPQTYKQIFGQFCGGFWANISLLTGIIGILLSVDTAGQALRETWNPGQILYECLSAQESGPLHSGIILVNTTTLRRFLPLGKMVSPE